MEVVRELLAAHPDATRVADRDGRLPVRIAIVNPMCGTARQLLVPHDAAIGVAVAARFDDPICHCESDGGIYCTVASGRG